MLGKQVKFENLRPGQRAAIRKLERVNGWEAVTITAHPCTDHDDTTVNVVFDTGPRRMDFASVMLCSVGWSVTAKDGLGKRILTEEEFDAAQDEERARNEQALRALEARWAA